MESCGAYFKYHLDKDLFDYFQSHYRHFFPALGDRPSFVRQAANLWQVKAEIWQLLVERSGQAQTGVQVIDTWPLPVCTYTRSIRNRCFKTWAGYGHCAAKKLDYYGFKLGSRVSAQGRKYLQDFYRSERAKLEEKIRQAVIHLYSQGVYVSLRPVAEYLNKPSYNGHRAVAAIIRETREWLDSERKAG